LQGVIRGKPVRTTISDKATPCPLDHFNRQFKAADPNALWLSGFTYVATWAGFVYVAFVIDPYARRIVGWRVLRTAHAGFVLDALEQALHDRRPRHRSGLVHHSDRGAQYVSIKYTERLAEAGIEPSVGSVGDSYDNALAETIKGLYKAEVIHRRGPWQSFEAVAFTTLEWVDWFNNRRLLAPIRNIPTAEAEKHYTPRWTNPLWQRDSNETASEKLGAVHTGFLEFVQTRRAKTFCVYAKLLSGGASPPLYHLGSRSLIKGPITPLIGPFVSARMAITPNFSRTLESGRYAGC
jgi:putative transposase